jgi:lysine 2,3-aminomutase
MTTLRSASELVKAELVPVERLAELERVAARYAVAVTPAMAELIDTADPDDPIARQFVPDPRELAEQAYERADPIGDDAHSPLEGIVHRYPDRVLLKLTHVCAVYCRFCFRREMVGPGKAVRLSRAAREAAIAYIAAHPEIWEVILTGGDPLVLPAPRLREVVERLRAVDHVKVVRVHTRVPIVAPEAVTAEMVAALAGTEKPTYVALHVNHARELTAAARAACARLADAGIPLLGQSVLLRGVNDDADTLAALMRALVQCRIRPYYLHHGDLAPGTSHLRTSVAQGQALMRALRGRLSGLCQPTYVLDIPGGFGKSPVGPNYLERAGRSQEAYLVEDYEGRRHPYPPGGPHRPTEPS